MTKKGLFKTEFEDGGCPANPELLFHDLKGRHSTVLSFGACQSVGVMRQIPVLAREHIPASSVLRVAQKGLIMPDVEGLELIRRLRKSGFAGRILAISGGGMVVTENHLHAARHLGADRVLAKPFSLTELTTTVHQLLGADQ